MVKRDETEYSGERGLRILGRHQLSRMDFGNTGLMLGKFESSRDGVNVWAALANSNPP